MVVLLATLIKGSSCLFRHEQGFWPEADCGPENLTLVESRVVLEDHDDTMLAMPT